MALPTSISATFSWAGDGITYVGPFISSGGNVYVVALLYDSLNSRQYVYIYKATDPASGFSPVGSFWYGSTDSTSSGKACSATQYGDQIWFSWQYESGGYRYCVQKFDMSTDTMGGTPPLWGGLTPINAAIFAQKRATGSDIIVFYNTSGVAYMGKTYGRIAAKRMANEMASVGAQTIIGIDPAATTQQTESVDSVVLGSSDRVHLFWTQTYAGAPATSYIKQRTVKSSDNLDGTQPATSAQNVTTGALTNVLVTDAIHASGQPFLSSGGVIAVPVHINASSHVSVFTATSADTPSWSEESVSDAAPYNGGYGYTNQVSRLGGAPWDGTNKTAGWMAAASPYYKKYDKNTGSGWGTDGNIDTGSGGTVDLISVNVYQRGNNVVLAAVYGSYGSVKYNEVVLRTAGLSGAISPAIFTVTPQALSTAVGDASRTLTNVIFTFTPVALTKSVGGVTASISPAIFTITPVALATSGNVAASISPVIFTETPVALATTVGEASRTLGIPSFTFTPVALSPSVGDVSASISPAIFTLSPVELTGEAAGGPQSGSITPVVLTFDPQTLNTSIGDVSTTLGVVNLILNAVELVGSAGDVSTTLGVVNLMLTLVGLTTAVGDTQRAITAVDFILSPVSLATSVGDSSSSITPVSIIFDPVILSASLGSVSLDISPVILTFNPVDLTYLVGDVSYTLTPVTMTFLPFGLTGYAEVPGEGYISSALFTFVPVELTASVGSVDSSINPVQFVLIPVALTESIGGISGQIGMVSFILVPVELTYSIGDTSATIDPVNLILTAIALSVMAVIGGKIKVWDGNGWIERPIKVWMGSDWVEKPLKYWTGITWELT